MIQFDRNFKIPDNDINGKQTFINPLGTDGHPDPCIVYCEQDKCYYGISTSGKPSLWSDDYAVGVLEYKGKNMVCAESWEKHPYPIVKKSGGKFGPGHAAFFYSPDKTELWICHHCVEKSNPSVEPIKRPCHCQRVYFDETGFPHVGDLVPENIPYPVPSENIN